MKMEKKHEKYEDTKSNLAIIFEKGVRPMTEKLKLGLKFEFFSKILTGAATLVPK